MRKLLHFIHAVLFEILFFSGLLLYIPALRGLLADYRLYLQKIHAYTGELFSLIVLVYLGCVLHQRRPWQGLKPGCLTVFAAFLAMAAWLGTGWMLLGKKELGPALTAYSSDVHRWLFYLSVPTVLWHIWAVWSKSQSAADASSNRRRFFAWLAQGLGGIWIGSIAWQFLARNRTQNIRGKDNCDIFTPAPVPSPDSLPPVGGGMRGVFGEYSVVNFLPCLHQDTWKFTIDGLVERQVSFRWEDFVRLPRTVQVSDFHCVEGWSVFNITYEGLLVADLLRMCGVNPEARFVKFYSADGDFADTLSLEQAHMKDVMIVMLMDGKPIPRVLGGPARLIVPQMYAYKAVKWVNRIELIDKPYLGYWEWRGFDTDAWLGKY